MVPRVSDVSTRREDGMTQYRVEELTAATWPAFEALVRKHNGIFGGDVG